MLEFSIVNRVARADGRSGRARAGLITTPHGAIETPAFIPVGTKATVKALSPEQVRDEAGAQAVLANTYHLYLQPGADILRAAGGLGKFMNWSGPTFTDSGGFQAFSLQGGLKDRNSKFSEAQARKESRSQGPLEPTPAPLASVDDDGVNFKSIIDGSAHRFTPESSIEIQHKIGADIIFALDECAQISAPYEAQKAAVERTNRWAERCLTEHERLGGAQALFGIGGTFEKTDMATAVGWACDELPEGKPRHLLGIGEPEDIILGIENGADTFDCVAPTRLGRNGAAYVRDTRDGSGFGRINLLNAQFVSDFAPIDPGCGCHTCKNYTRAYVAHLFRAKEMLAATLTSVHNLYFLINLAKEARQAIIAGRFDEFKKEMI